MFKIEKYQSAILGPSSSDSVAIFEKKLGKTFYWVFFKPAKKVDFWSKQDKFRSQNWEIILKLLLYIYWNKLYIKLYCVALYLK